jgi:hypothetical protein
MKKAQVFFLFAAFLAVTFTFQNCSAPLQEEGAADDASTTGGSGGSFASTINFAFDTQIDQVAYMSCHQTGTTFDKSTYFTFRIGGYGATAGTGITQTFLNQTNGMQPAIKKTMLTTSPANSGARPVLSIRRPTMAQQPYVMSGSTPNYQLDHSYMLGVLTDEMFASKFIATPAERIKYLRDGVNVEGLRLEGSLYLNNGYSGLEKVRTELINNNALIAINYSVPGNDLQSVRAPATYFTGTADRNNSVYGSGLRVSFKQAPSSDVNSPSWLLSQVDLVSMELAANGSRSESFNYLNCDPALAFKIIDPRDAATQGCAMKADNPSTTAETNLLRRARLTLRVEDWYIDLAKKCIVPKKTSNAVSGCYGQPEKAFNDPSRVLIEYDVTKPCLPSPSTTANKACPAFASICYR